MFSQEVIDQRNAHHALVASKEVIKDEESWCMEHYAVDVNNHPVPHSRKGLNDTVNSPDAIAWCLAGAIAKVAPGTLVRAVCYGVLGGIIVRDNDEFDLEQGAISRFNDCTTHKDVINLLDTAIKETKL